MEKITEKTLVDLVIKILEEHKAIDIVKLDITKLTDIASFMVIASGTSSRHVKSLSDILVEQAKPHGFRPLGIEGEVTCEWVLVDLDDVIVHIMLPETREFYSLEKLWDIGQTKLHRGENH